MERKPHRLNFKINHCSSEDPDYPVTELLLQSPEAKGWQSKRFSEYPQIIVIELFEAALLSQIAVLSHQSKISTKVQIEVKMSEQEEWHRLGRISLDANSNTNYLAREFKKANLNNPLAKLVRLVFRANHVNSHNLFNQVGIISIAFYGEPADLNRQQPQVKNEVDVATFNRLKELEMRKKIAVENEEFDQAKQLKEQIDRLKSMGTALLALEEKKQEAIKREDFQSAKIINEKIKKMREQSTGLVRKEQSQINPQTQTSYQYREVRTEKNLRKDSDAEGEQAISPVTNPHNRSKPVTESAASWRKGEQPVPSRLNEPKEDIMQRPIQVKNTNPYEQRSEQQQQQVQQQEGELQKLPKELYEQCSPYFQALNEEIFRHLFSRSHQNREKGVAMILDELRHVRNREDFIGACLFVVKSLIDDKIPGVLIETMHLFNEMLKKLKPQGSSYTQLVQYILEKMADYLGHTNDKVRSIAEETFGNLPIYRLTDKEFCYRALIMPSKREKPPKVVIGRLKMLTRIIKENQLGKNYEAVIKYAVKYSDDKSNQVRAAASSLICAISSQVGSQTVLPHLKTLRPPILKAIQDKLQQNGEETNLNHDERPIKTNKSNKNIDKGEFESQGNQFIEVPAKRANSGQADITCEYCDKVDKRFIEQDYRDMHLFNACPMLVICKECGQASEISTYTAHLVGECKNSKYYKKCPRCKEAIHQKNYKLHVEAKECLSAKPMAVNNRCPLCHLDIPPGAAGWKEHLLEDSCENNPRA